MLDALERHDEAWEACQRGLEFFADDKELLFRSAMLSYPVADPWAAVSLISAGAFCAAFAGPCAYTAAIDMGGRHVTMVFSLMNMAGKAGAFAFPIMVLYLLNEVPACPAAETGIWCCSRSPACNLRPRSAGCLPTPTPASMSRRDVERMKPMVNELRSAK